jgi:ABC-type antimicrobial peptide transport system permease subunit
MVIRTNTEPEAIIPSLRQAFHDVDSGLPLGFPRTMPEVISDTLVSQRFQNWVFGTFAALALVLAIVGLYGLISQEILLSTRDIGVRMALGASRGKTFAAIYRRICLLLGGGLSAGLLITFLLKKVLATVVLISPGKDSGVILGLAACLFGAGLLATFLPALRASKVDPMVALRYE